MPDKQRRPHTAASKRSSQQNQAPRRPAARRTAAAGNAWASASASGSAVFQALEPRALMSVGLDSAGWTVVSPADDTRVIYVSSSGGNDGNNGLSAAAPVRSLGRAQSLVREGSGDWLLLKRGDTFDGFGDWRKSGRSADEPIYISAYGRGDRPQVDSGTRPGFITYQRGASTINNVVIQSIAFRAHTYNHYNGDGLTAGIRLTSSGRNWTIEDVLVDGYKDNVVFDAPSGTLRNITLRRSVIVDAHAATSMANGKAQGLYIGPNSDGVLVEQNVFDHNGWRPGQDGDRIVYNHNIYSKNGARNVVISENVISRGSFYGLKFNSGGVVRNNLFVRNSESIYLEDAATIEGNVITESVDMPNMAWGVGINTQKAGSATIRNNVITRTLSSSGGPAAGVQLFNNGTPFRGLVEGNIVYDWRNGLLVQTRGDGTDSVVIRGNHFQVPSSTSAVQHMSSAPVGAFAYENNIYSAGGRSEANKLNGSTQTLAEWRSKTGERGAEYRTIDYPDPGRSIGRYNAEQVGGRQSFEGFIEGARSMEKSNWLSAYTAAKVNGWFFRGFGVGGSGGSGGSGGGSSGGSTGGSTGGSSGGSTGGETGGTGGTGNTGGSTGNTGGGSGGTGGTGGGSGQQPTPAKAPRVTAAVLNVDQLPNALNLKFTANVGRSLDRGDIRVENLETGEVLPVRSVAYVASKNLAKFMLAELPEGNYRATLLAGSVRDADGNKLAKDQAWDFYVLAGDANRDRKVNIVDFSLVAANYARRATFTQGDFDYSGRVDGDDLDVVLSRYQLKVATPAAAVAARAGVRPAAAPTGTGAAAQPKLQPTRTAVFATGTPDDPAALI